MLVAASRAQSTKATRIPWTFGDSVLQFHMTKTALIVVAFAVFGKEEANGHPVQVEFVKILAHVPLRKE